MVAGVNLTNKVVMDAIWRNQIRLIAGRVLLSQGNDAFFVCPKTIAAFENAASENRHSLRNLNIDCSPGFILNHINELRELGRLNLAKGKRVINFCINSYEAKEAFKDARAFWLSKGVPGPEITDGSRSSKKFEQGHLEELLKECHEMLKVKYSSIPEKKIVPEAMVI